MNQRINVAMAGVLAGLAGAANAAAQTRLQDKFFGGGDTGPDDVASAGNGGVASASANGGAVSIGDINSGGNVGCAISVGDTFGTVPVDPSVTGCAILNTTAVDVSAAGGTAIANAAGGNYNLAFVS
jgi:hypothetical protein